MIKSPYFFNNKTLRSISKKNSLSSLRQEGHTVKVKSESFGQALEGKINFDAHFVQYKMFVERNGSKKYAKEFFRLSGESLEVLKDLGINIEIDCIALDYDFGVGEKKSWDHHLRSRISEIDEEIRSDSILENFAWCPTENGIRFFTTINPIGISLESDLSNRFITPSEWKSTYKNIANSITARLPEGHFDIATPSNYFSTFRMPRAIKDNGFDLSNSPIFWGDNSMDEPNFDVLIYYSVDSSKKTTRNKFELKNHFSSEVDRVIFEDEHLTQLYHEPVFSKIRQEGIPLSYPCWRGLGTSICASTMDFDKGLHLFNELSSWSPNYNPSSVKKEWDKIWKSKEDGYGPYTYKRLEEGMQWIRDLGLPEDSSPSGFAFVRAKEVIQSRYTIRTQTKTETGERKVQEYNQKVITIDEEVNPLKSSNFTIDDVKGLLRTKLVGSGENVKEEIKKDILNLEIILDHDIAYKNKLKRNLLGCINMFGDVELSDEIITTIRTNILRDYGIQFQKADMEDKIKELCSRYQYNPITDYLISLPKWDGVDRITLLLESLSIFPDNPFYNLYHTYLKKFLISSVVRPLQYFIDSDNPSVNTKVDTLFVLQGSQGLKKSTFFENLVPYVKLFSDSLQSLESNPKDAYIHMLNYWIIEFSEFDGLVKKSSQEFLKAFLSRKSERYRPPYGKTEIMMPRPSVLVGTTNATTFLNDPTGSRRYWVIPLDERVKINIDVIKKNRDMIWAQAVSLFQAGDQWWLTDEEQELSDSHNTRFSRQDPWVDAIVSWISEDKPMYADKFGFRLQTLFNDCLNIDNGRIRISDTIRVKKILETIGLEEKRERVKIGSDIQKIKIWRKIKVETEDKKEVDTKHDQW